ncbi:hypothetical protein [Candidatus Pelagibacter sp. HIMB1321]|uniref:hypothetical protein n=1 Tax=Candidatus Pelagibacter sp. HIMB1321 TaxID=1388755 RepID=UPI0012EDF01C|nr:hypothetical protein [Candidatus Pelagibacter sp. HIMB1321]
MKKIVFLTSQPLDQRNFYRFGLDIFIKHNWNIIYCHFNVTNNSNKIFENKKKVKSKDLKKLKNYTISNFKELKNILNKIEHAYYADFTIGSLFKIYANLKLEKKNTRLIFNINNYPNLKKSELRNFFDIFKNLLPLKSNFYKILRLVINKTNNFFINYIYKKPILVFSGKVSYNKNQYLKVINNHAMDYDFFIKDSDSKIETQSIVFIDAYLENHPDLTFLKKKVVTKKKYFSSLSNFFSKIEEKFNNKVIVAIHPRAPFDKTRYKENKKFFYDTYNLIKKSKLVIMHGSTSANFACILKKPILFIYTNEMSKNYPKSVHNIKFFAKEFGTKAINIDDNKNINFKSYLEINEKKYEEYFSKYVMNNKKDSYLFWEKIIFELEKI